MIKFIVINIVYVTRVLETERRSNALCLKYRNRREAAAKPTEFETVTG